MLVSYCLTLSRSLLVFPHSSWYQQTIGKLARQSIVIASLMLCIADIQAAQNQTVNNSLEQQITQLRQILLEQDLRMSELQEEIQDIRGKNEILLYQLEQLKQQQQDIYVDLDQRLTQLKSAQTAMTVTAPTTSMLTMETVGMSSMDTMASTAGTPATNEVPPTTTTAPPTQPPPVANSSAEEESTYQTAFKLLQAGRYSEAIDGFKKVLQQFSQGTYADNAQYWIGESHYALHHFDQSLQEFNQLLQHYPDSPKRAHALLKMGYVHYELRDYSKAREALNKVVTAYPNSASARLADQRLQRMQTEGK